MEPLAAGDPRQVGEYRLRARLGSGGMGRVFLGYSPAGQAVAVKVIRPELAADMAFRVRFRREVAAARTVSSAYTAPLVAAAPDEDPPWMATALVAGPSLADAVDAHGPFAADALWRLAAGLAQALAAIHACGLVHRDLKPANVLLALTGPLVIDFGISRALEGTVVTTTGQVVGTPPFMSPEQARSDETTPASDVFALGAVLTFAATGNGPFGDGRPAAVLYRVVYNEPALDRVPDGLRELAASCLAKDPAARPSLAEIAWAVRAGATAGPSSPGSFWPQAVSGLIRQHQARLAADLAGYGINGAGGPVDAGVVEDAAQRWPAAPQDWVLPAGLVRDATAPSGLRMPGTGTGRPGLTRRRVLAGLGGLGGVAAVGTGVGLWATSRPQRRPHLPSAGPSLTPVAQAATPSPTPAGPAPGTQLWTTQVPGGLAINVYAALVAGAGNLYIAGVANQVSALSAATGEVVWKTPVQTGGGGPGSIPLGDASVGNAALSGDVVYTDGYYNDAVALHAADGTKIWGVSVGSGAYSDVTVADGNVYLVAWNDLLYALAAASGAQRWGFTVPGGHATNPAAGAGAVYVVDAGNTLHALRAASGASAWTATVPGGAVTGPFPAGGVVYIAAKDNNLHALGAAGGRAAWVAGIPGGAVTAPAVSGGVVYIGGGDGSLHALSAASGKQTWKAAIPGGLVAVTDTWKSAAVAPAVAGGTVYVAGKDSSLYALSAADGSQLWSAPFGGGQGAASTPVPVTGAVCIAALDGSVYALAI